MRKILLVLALLLTFSGYAQKFDWAKSTGITWSLPLKVDSRGGFIAHDAAGNIYTVQNHKILDPNQMSDGDPTLMTVAKYDPNGNLIWHQSFAGDVNNWHFGLGLAITSAGDAYVLGTFFNSVNFGTLGLQADATYAPHQQVFLLKMNTNGVVQWARQGGGLGLDEAGGIALDTQENIIITGLVQWNAIFENSLLTGDLSDLDGFVAKYTPQGNVVWVKRLVGFDQGNSTARSEVSAIDTDAQNNLYIAGNFRGLVKIGSILLDANGYTAGFLAKLNAAGDVIWAKKISSQDRIYPKRIILDDQNNCYITGGFEGPATFGGTSLQSIGGLDVFVAKYNNSGIPIWARQGGSASYDYGLSLALDGANNVYVGGYTYESGIFGQVSVTVASQHQTNGYIAQYSSAGQVKWVEMARNTHGAVYDISHSPQGNFHVIGSAVQGNLSIGTFPAIQIPAFETNFFLTELDGNYVPPVLQIDDVFICYPCWPWEFLIDFEYRFWSERESVRTATYRKAFDRDNLDDVFWKEGELTIRLHDELPVGRYNFQIRALLEDGSSTEWTEVTGFSSENKLASVYPNPIKDVLNVRYYALADETVALKLLTRYGELLMHQQQSMRKGLNDVTLRVPHVDVKNNPLTFQLQSRLQGSFTWQLIKE